MHTRKIDPALWNALTDKKNTNRHKSRRFSMPEIIKEELAKVDNMREKQRELDARNRKTTI